MDQFPQEMRLHVFGGAGSNLHFRYRNQHLITYYLHLAGIRFRRYSLIKYVSFISHLLR